MGPSASAASAISSTVPTLSVPEPGSVPRCGSCSVSTKAASTAASLFRSGSAKGSYTMPGGTPKKTAQVEESRRRPRNPPGHWKVSGEATGTKPRFLKASHCPMLASPFVGTSDTSMPSMYATQALSDVSLRSPADATLPLPFGIRSEEHTSELQSRQYLVCRLLLEKINHSYSSTPAITGAAHRLTIQPHL